MEEMTAMEKVKALYTGGLAGDDPASLSHAAEMLLDMGDIDAEEAEGLRILEEMGVPA